MGVVLPYPSFVFSGFLRTSWLERGTQFHTLFVSIIINCFIGDWEHQKQIQTMKKYFLLLLVALLIPRNTFAYDFEVDGISYDVISLTDFTCKVSHSNDARSRYVGDVVIPATVNYGNRTLTVTEIGYMAFISCEQMTSITMPNTITKIDGQAFRNCSSLTNIIIPNSVTEMGEAVFLDCRRLQQVSLSSALTWIPRKAFYNCQSLESITIPNSVTKIEYNAFEKCGQLKNAIIPVSVTEIGGWVFWDCSSLTNVMLPNSIQILGNGMFSGCTSLDNMVVPNTIETIPENLFDGCSNLKSVTLGNAVQEIKQNVFNGCYSLETLYMLTSTPPAVQTNSFTTAQYMALNVFVPEGTLAAYQNAETWNTFWNLQEGTEDTPNVPMEKCATPTIQYANGKLTFSCATPDAVCQTTITNDDIKLYSGNEIQLGITYNISVYATKPGYEYSDMVTATLCWIDAAPQTDGISNGVAEVKALPVMIQSANGTVLVNGLDDDTQVSVYSVNGMHVGSAISNVGQARISTNMESGSIAIVKMGDKSVKVLMK